MRTLCFGLGPCSSSMFKIRAEDRRQVVNVASAAETNEQMEGGDNTTRVNAFGDGEVEIMHGNRNCLQRTCSKAISYRLKFPPNASAD